MLRLRPFVIANLVFILAGVSSGEPDTKPPLCISGRYPHLAMFNQNGECGTGALAVWADRLWVITYGPHMEHGSDDKLYEIDEQLNRITRSESVGGTPADRMIHRESNQLIIGPYFIDEKRNVRAISPKAMPGRITAAFRSLTDSANKIDFYMMEGSLWEADVKTLDAKQLFEKPIPGWHGKGAYSGQGRLVFANNGETPVGNKKFTPLTGPETKDAENAGALAEFDGKNWRLIERRQFTDVTGPGGLDGAPAENAPLWAIGWDERSILLEVRDARDGAWHKFRLPKMDLSYNAKHGWYTEWPRIREVMGGKFLMNMHGGWFEFPKTMSASNYGGLKPLGSYLKITGDFCAWKDRIVFGCDDLDTSEFRGTSAAFLDAQSQSNLWFSTWDGLSRCGRSAGWGGVWQGDMIAAGVHSDPYLFGGFTRRVLHLSHDSDQSATFAIEIDADGTGKWNLYNRIDVPAHGYAFHIFPNDTPGQWARVSALQNGANVHASFHYGPGGGAETTRGDFDALADAGSPGAVVGGLVLARGENKGTLAFEAQKLDAGKIAALGVFEISPELSFHQADESILNKQPMPAPSFEISTDDASVIVTEKEKKATRRFRLPKSDAAYDRLELIPARQIREVVTERALLNAHGTFYMLPRPTAGGVEAMKPICTHGKRIFDFCSWRGLLCISGTKADAKPDAHYFPWPGNNAGLWFGDIDDLWKMGKPVGVGGPWKNTAVKDGAPSDPYLMTGYDKKSIALAHDAQKEVTFTIEVNFDFSGWHSYQKIKVPAGKTIEHEFPAGYSAHWLRVLVDTDCSATALCKYE
ncbi:MAG TPA: hypothetical protein VKX17_17055 [Planctomycetota bacterium]|nr:hypothetical protein [Planctomycetota bacterium]